MTVREARFTEGENPPAISRLPAGNREIAGGFSFRFDENPIDAINSSYGPAMPEHDRPPPFFKTEPVGPHNVTFQVRNGDPAKAFNR